MPKLTIVTINLNNKDGLEKTMQSVFSQNYSDFEYLVIDGGSKDGSLDVIDNYERGIAYWVSEPDKGIYNAMNNGIQKANGEYIQFLNSGDYFNSGDILSVVFSKSNKEDVIFGNLIFEGELDPYLFSDTVTLNSIWYSSIGHGTSFIKKSLFDKYGLYNENNKIVSDWEFFVKVLLKYSCSYKHIDKIITVCQPGGISTNPSYSKMQLDERLMAIKRNLPEYYDTLVEYLELKEELGFYKNSRLIQLVKKLQTSKLYRALR